MEDWGAFPFELGIDSGNKEKASICIGGTLVCACSMWDREECHATFNIVGF